MIKVGGKPWRSLVKEGIIANDPIAPIKPLLEKKVPLFSGGTIEEAKKKKAELMDQVVLTERKDNIEPQRRLRPNHFPARRGKKVVEVAKTPRQEEIAEYTAQCASRTLHKHIDSLSDSLEDAYDNVDGDSTELGSDTLKEFEENLKNLILEEMISGEAAKAPTHNTRIARHSKQKKYVEPETEYELDSEYGDQDSEF